MLSKCGAGSECYRNHVENVTIHEENNAKYRMGPTRSLN